MLTNRRRAAAEQANRWRSIGLIAIITIGVLGSIAPTEPWKLIEARAFDYLSTLLPPEVADDAPVIVAIDEPSFAEIGLQWPWPRSLHADLVKALREAGTKAIGLDMIFAEPSTDAAADAALAAALGPDVTLAGDQTVIATPQADQVMRVEPLPELLAAGAMTGIASIALDNDGTLRRIPRYPDGFAAVLAKSAGVTPADIPDEALLQTFGPARSFQTVSYYQALKPAEFLPKDFFRGRVAIVGLSLQSSPSAEAGGADSYATSFTLRSKHLVAGAEIQATIYENITKGLFIATASPFLVAALTIFAVLAAAVAIWRNTSWVTALFAALAVAVSVAGSFLLLRFAQLYVPPVAPAFAFVAVAAAQTARDYAAERRLRRSITRAFQQYLSPVLVDRLAAEPARLRLGGERKTLSILFSDVRGFTTISEALKDEPERLTTLMHRLLNPLSAVVLSCGGTIDKYIGDAIMAFWNAPLDDPDHAVHAVEAALGMLKALDALNDELAKEAQAAGEEPIWLAIGVGINTGDVVVGNMGSEHRFDYSALGDAVNLGARLEGETKNYDVPILLGELTAELAAARFTVVELDRIKVKGKTLPTRVSTVVPEADEDALAIHKSVLDDFYSGRLKPSDERLDMLQERLPTLRGYYGKLRARLKG
ncbi:CHASE2 domain-containing protein [Mesorhizobium sp. BAC0120]|uniref:CHASE2 domain-containing protein n=1 Tax=Mesorhizobium sp. BAC0120 TaxID=3090670 RepID=UPI0039999AFB